MHSRARLVSILLASLALCVGSSCRTAPQATPTTVIDEAAREAAFLEQLEEIIAQGPGKSRWQELLTMLEAWEHAPISDSGVARLNKAFTMAKWDDELRVVPDHWEALDAPIPRRDLWKLARHLDVQQRPLSFENLESAAHLAEISWVSLHGPESLQALVEAWDNNTLPEHVHLRASGVKMDAVSPLLSHKRRAKLETLILWDNQLGASLGNALVSARSWPNLHRLDIGSNNLRGEGLEKLALLAAPKLEILQLDWNAFPPGDQSARWLSKGSERWPRLKKLYMGSNGLDSASVKVLSQASSLQGLEALSLENNPLDDDALEALVKSPVLANLKELKLSRTGITGEGCAHFEQASFAGLELLDIGRNAVGPACARSIARAPFMPTLAALIAPGSRWETTAIEALTQPGLFPTLHALNLASNDLTGEDCMKLAKHDAWSRLRSLSLQKNPLGDACPEALARMPVKFEHLILAHSEMTDVGFRALVAGDSVSEASKLEVGWNALTAESAAALVNAACSKGLENLSLEGNTLEHAGLKVLLQAKFPALRSLELGWTGLQDDSATLIAKTTWLEQLDWIDLQGNGFTREGVVEIQQAEQLNASIRKEFTARYLHVLGSEQKE
jgi:Ran GTPase-activating protein (RanGAP) involved in mRNA processing and transport